MLIPTIWISWLYKYLMMNTYWCYLIEDHIAFMKYWKLGQDVISNIKSNSNWPWQKLTLLIQVMKNPSIVLPSVKTKSHDSDNVIKVIVISFSIPWLCRLHSQMMRRAFSLLSQHQQLQAFLYWSKRGVFNHGMEESRVFILFYHRLW